MEWDWAIDGWILFVGTLSACSCALLGNYLVLRRLSLMGDAISHAVLPGLAIAFLITSSRAAWPMFAGAVIVGVITALLTQVITRYGKVEHGAAMGVVFSILFAIGLVLIRQVADHVDLDPGCVLYGNIVQIALDAQFEDVPPAARNLACVFVLNILFVGLFYKELKISSFDPDLATTLGINATLMHYALMVMVAVTTVANFESVGSILVIAMLIVPAATAHLLTDRLGVMILLSQLIACFSAVTGHLLACYGPGWVGVDAVANTSAMMAVVVGFVLFVAIFLAPEQGLLAKWYHRMKLSSRIVRQDVLGLLYRWEEMNGESGRSMRRDEVLTVVGGGSLPTRALRKLLRQNEIVRMMDGRDVVYRLTDSGKLAASQLVGAHRLWESYLAKHFHLASDHLHEPANRMEHYITPELREELREQLTDPKHDPHGKSIPSEPM